MTYSGSAWSGDVSDVTVDTHQHSDVTTTHTVTQGAHHQVGQRPVQVHSVQQVPQVGQEGAQARQQDGQFAIYLQNLVFVKQQTQLNESMKID